MRTPYDIERAIKDGASEQLTAQEVDAVLEVGYLAIAADGRLTDSEADAFVGAMLKLYGKKVTAKKIHELMAGFADGLERGKECLASRCDRLRDLAPKLRGDAARDQAYQLSYALSLSDMETNDEEFAFDQALRRALKLTDERADELADEVAVAVLGRDSVPPRKR